MLKNQSQTAFNPPNDLDEESACIQYDIDHFIQSCKQKSKEALLDALLEFAGIFKQKPFSWFKKNTEHLERSLRKLKRYYHPDDYQRSLPSLQQKDVYFLNEAFCYLSVINETLQKEKIDQDISQKPEVKIHLRPTLNQLDSIEKLTVILHTEEICFEHIQKYFVDLSHETRQFLLRTYGRIISLTFNLAVHYHLPGLTENMQRLEARLQIIRPYLEKAGLSEEFEQALRFSILIDDNKGSATSLHELEQDLIIAAEEKEAYDRENKKSKRIKAAVGFSITVGFSVLLSVLTAGVALPFFISGIAINAATSAGGVAASEIEQKELKLIRERYFDCYFMGIVSSLTKLSSIMQQEVAHRKYLRDSAHTLIQWKKTLYHRIGEKLSHLHQPSFAAHLSDSRYINLLEITYFELEKKLNQSGLSNSEQEQLKLLGIDPTGSSVEAVQELQMLLAIGFSAEEQQQMRSIALSGFLEDNSVFSSCYLLTDHSQHLKVSAEEKSAEEIREPLNHMTMQDNADLLETPITSVMAEETKSPDALTSNEQIALKELGIACNQSSREEIQELRSLLAIGFSEKEKIKMRSLAEPSTPSLLSLNIVVGPTKQITTQGIFRQSIFLSTTPLQPSSGIKNT